MDSGYTFSPSSVTLLVGDTVRVTNTDTTHHTFTGSGFDSGDLGQGGTYTYRFARAGSFAFVCSYHSSVGMQGTVTVHAG